MSASDLVHSLNRLLGGRWRRGLQPLTNTFDVLPLDRSIVDVLQRVRFRCFDLLLPVLEDLLAFLRGPLQALLVLERIGNVAGSLGEAS